MSHPMRPRIVTIAACIGIALVALPAADARDDAPPAAPSAEFFEKKIRPVLAGHCYQCHSADAQRAKKLKAGLLLDNRDGLLHGGDSGPAVIPGKPDDSRLIQALRHAGDLKMPPKGKLPDSVIADF